MATPVPNLAPPPAQPLVSVVVPTFNRGRFLERCLRSILDQTYPHLECLVMDGGSTDQTLAILRRLAASDRRLRFVSEPDGGEVYATNKGMDLARGNLLGVQASDDQYVLDAVEHAVKFLLNHPDYLGVAGDALYVDENGKPAGRGVITYRGRICPESIRHILRVRYKSCFICHGSFFGWRERMLRHGKLDPEFSVTPDWDYYLRLVAAGEKIGSLRRVQYLYTAHAGMGAEKYRSKVEAQRAAFHQRYGMRWYDLLFRSTIGRAMSYCQNPYRTPLLEGMRRECGEILAKAGLKGRQA